MQTNNHQWFNDYYFRDHYQGELDEYVREVEEYE